MTVQREERGNRGGHSVDFKICSLALSLRAALITLSRHVHLNCCASISISAKCGGYN